MMARQMIVDADELDARLSAIGDSVRAKTGKAGLIPVDGIPSEIDGIGTAKAVLEAEPFDLVDHSITKIGDYVLFHNYGIKTLIAPKLSFP